MTPDTHAFGTMTLYGELTKLEPLDDGSIRVHGVASSGARDGTGEVVAPDAMRKALPAYMAFGAIREMHQPRAAGAALYAEVDDEGLTRICAHVVDPLAVKKVKAGVYKGLSIGGKVLARDADDPSCITAIRLDEISLVDRPCNPEAVIDLWKAAPAAAPSNEAVRDEAERMAKAAGRPGRRNDYVAAARAKLMEARVQLTSAHPGEGRDPDHKAPPPEQDQRQPPPVKPFDLGPGLRRDERVEEAAPLAKLADDLAKLAAEREGLQKRLQSYSMDVSFDQKMLYGQTAFAQEMARGKAKCDFKASMGRVDPVLFNSIFWGQAIAPGQTRAATGEVVTGGATTYAVANASAFQVDLGVFDSTLGKFLTRVASAPAEGQYAVNTASGTYTFATADETAALKVYYTYGAPSTGQTVSVTNPAMDSGPVFRADLVQSYRGKQSVITAWACQAFKLSFPLKQDDFTLPEISFSAMDNGSGSVLTHSLDGY